MAQYSGKFAPVPAVVGDTWYNTVDSVDYTFNGTIWINPLLVAPAAAITAPTTPSAAYVQAEATSMKTAVDAIRVALTNAGITL